MSYSYSDVDQNNKGYSRENQYESAPQMAEVGGGGGGAYSSIASQGLSGYRNEPVYDGPSALSGSFAPIIDTAYEASFDDELPWYRTRLAYIGLGIIGLIGLAIALGVGISQGMKKSSNNAVDPNDPANRLLGSAASTSAVRSISYSSVLITSYFGGTTFIATSSRVVSQAPITLTRPSITPSSTYSYSAPASTTNYDTYTYVAPTSTYYTPTSTYVYTPPASTTDYKYTPTTTYGPDTTTYYPPQTTSTTNYGPATTTYGSGTTTTYAAATTIKTTAGNPKNSNA